ncbi:MAG: ACP S-malonyltransferase [Anaerolineales bacterium]|nr:ACP S-malonyltransferase [Anaerolineales bacterium]
MTPDPLSTAFIFPGQGSQKVGMGKELAAAHPEAAAIFQQADETLGFAFSALCWDGPEAELNDTVNTQPALFVHSVAALRVFEKLQPGFRPAFVAGHSLGELSAAVAAGALDFAAGLRLVRRRGELMKQAGERSPGGMAAILGLDIPAVETACAAASTADEVAQVANDNCPGQVVISGHSAAVERAMEATKAAGAKRALPLAVSIAAHSPLMASVQAEFAAAIAEANPADPGVPMIGNVDAAPLADAAALSADLEAQLTARVRWTESIQAMRAAGVQTFIELGTGSVLTGLLKRIDAEAGGIALGEPADFDKLTAETG